MKYKPVCFVYPQVKVNMMCKSKKRFRTEKEAASFNKKQRAYKCPYCKRWHLSAKNSKAFTRF